MLPMHKLVKSKIKHFILYIKQLFKKFINELKHTFANKLKILSKRHIQLRFIIARLSRNFICRRDRSIK